MIENLLASIDRTNNGYLFAPTDAELALARQHPEAVKIINGRIARVSTGIGYYPDPKARAPSTPDDGFDFEGAILARQRIDV